MSWRKVKLGELLDNFSVRAKDAGGAANLDFLGVNNEAGIIKTKYAAEDKSEEYKIIERDCFAYNPYRVNVGSIGLVTENIKGLISPAYVVFKPKPRSIKAELLLKFLKSTEGLRQIRFYARGTVRQALRFEDLCKIELSLPDYDEQEILFKKLNSVQIEGDLLSNELTQQLLLIKKLRQQILEDAVQGKLVEQNLNDEPASELLKRIKAEKEQLIKEKKFKKEKGLPPIKLEEIPFKIPENWVWCRLGEIIFSMNNGIYKEDKYYNDNGIACLRMYNIQNGILSLHNLKRMILTQREIETYGLKNGDLLLNRVNSIELLGKSAYIDNLNEPTVFESKNIRIRFSNNSIPKFINYLFQTSILKDQILLKFKKVTGQASINQDQLSTLIIPFPPLSEQQLIVQKLEEFMQLILNLEENLKQGELQTVKLLQQVLKEVLNNRIEEE